MTTLTRRNWVKGLAGASALVLHPRQILELLPKDDESIRPHNANGQLVRLSSNENPYSPSEPMRQAIQNAQKELCRYPNRHFGTLEKKIGEKIGQPAENIVVTSGSREGLNVSGLVYGMNGGEILTCMPTYKSLLTYAERFGAYINVAPLTDDLGYNLDALDKRIHSNTKMVFVCNPNNPTGTLLDAGQLRDFCRQASKRTMVFVDEAYFDYIEEENYPSMAELVNEGHNVIVSRTFSKIYGLAGVRVGYLIARPDVATRLRQRLMSGTNVMGLRLAMASLKDEDFYNFSLSKNKAGKEMIYAALDQAGLPYIRSHTNFVFFKTGQPISDIAKKFKDEGIWVGRPFPPYDDWCRISTGLVEEVKSFCDAIPKVFA